MIDAKDLRLLKLTEIDSLPIPCVLYRKDEDGFHTVIVSPEEVKSHPKITKATIEYYCREKRMFSRINKPFRNFV